MSSFNETVRGELRQYRRDGLIDAQTYRALASRYPTEGWNGLALGRWFLIFGGLNVVAGLGILLYEYVEWSLSTLAGLELIAVLLVLTGGFLLKKNDWTWTGHVVELLGGLGVVGLTFTVAAIVSTETGDIQPLWLLNLGLVLPLAYGLLNPLLIVESLVLFFFWVGGVAGYSSFWGGYWLGVHYPMRFLVCSSGVVIVGLLHRHSTAAWMQSYRSFYKVWLSVGLLYGEIALWLLSLFGAYGAISWFSPDPGALELWTFNLLWMAVNVVLVVLGLRWSFGMLTGYGVTFFVVHVYTKFFELVVRALDPIGVTVSLLGLGILTLVVVFLLERKLNLSKSFTSGR